MGSPGDYEIVRYCGLGAFKANEVCRYLQKRLALAHLRI